MSSGIEFKPRILGFVCNWCCYGGADLCGVSRFQYPPYIRLIRVMCSGRIDMLHIFRAFSNGQDGVFVGGCHLGDCHYITNGNYDALSMIHICKKLLAHIGVNPDRLRLEWVSAGEGIRFANIMNEYGMKVKELGPLGKAEGIDVEKLKTKLKAITKLIPYIRLVERERLRVHFAMEEEYDTYFGSEEVNRLFQELIVDKLAMVQIMALLREQPRSTGELSEILGLTPSEVSKHLSNSARQGLARFDESRKRFVCS
jgi:F420-non-reducing hydrogenase iron-sulfur subunit